MINDDKQVLKVLQTAKGEKVTTISSHRTRPESEYLYVSLSRKVEGGSERLMLSLDEVFCCAKLGIEPGTPEGKNALKQYRHENGLMGRVTNAMGDAVKEQQLVNLLHADLVRQMHDHGMTTCVDNHTVHTVAQLLLDYLKICKESSAQSFTQEVDTRTGTQTVENPIWSLKLKLYDRLITGLRGLGLTFERVTKQLPTDAVSSVSSDMFEQKEHEEQKEKAGITWVND